MIKTNQIVSGFTLPEIKQRKRASYNWEACPVGQGFAAPGKTINAMSSTCAAASKRLGMSFHAVEGPFFDDEGKMLADEGDCFVVRYA